MSQRINLELLDEPEIERLLMKAVVPRPVVWITSSAGPEGPVVLAPFSAIVPICNSPPLILLSVQRRDDGVRKTTAVNILRERDFVVNVLDEHLIEAAVRASDPRLSIQDRVELAGIHFDKSATVKAPRILECVFSLECVLQLHHEVGQRPNGADLFIAEVISVVQNYEDGKSGSSDLFTGVGALSREWYLTRTGISYIPQAE
jgi:flavin reductase (DIM6/NTAB) family NADH-FMN oxidoreductase RutF